MIKFFKKKNYVIYTELYSKVAAYKGYVSTSSITDSIDNAVKYKTFKEAALALKDVDRMLMTSENYNSVLMRIESISRK